MRVLALPVAIVALVALTGCGPDQRPVRPGPAPATSPAPHASASRTGLDVTRLGPGWQDAGAGSGLGLRLCGKPVFTPAGIPATHDYTAPGGESVTVSWLRFGPAADPVGRASQLLDDCSLTGGLAESFLSEELAADPFAAYTTTLHDNTPAATTVYSAADLDGSGLYVVVALRGDASLDPRLGWGVTDAVARAATAAYTGDPYGPVGAVGVEPTPQDPADAAPADDGDVPPVGVGTVAPGAHDGLGG